MRELNMTEIQTVSGGLFHPNLLSFSTLGLTSALVATGVVAGCFFAYGLVFSNDA